MIDARRVFASGKNTCCLPSRRPCFSHLLYPRLLVPRWLEVDAVEVKVDSWFHTLEGRFNAPSMVFLEMTLFLLQRRIREKEKFLCKMQEEDLRCYQDCMSFLLNVSSS